MDYMIPVAKEMNGDIISLINVAEAMARKAASGYSKLQLHEPTLENSLSKFIRVLHHAALSGQLSVCDIDGCVIPANDIASNVDVKDASAIFGEEIAKFVLFHVRACHLIEWGKINGDVFQMADAPVTVVEFGPKNERGEFAYRGFCDADTSDHDMTAPATKVEAKRSITKKAVITAFNGIHFSGDRWNRNLADTKSAPWLLDCRVSRGLKGNRFNPSTWNPILIAAELFSKGIPINRLDAVFQIKLKDWFDEWIEVSKTFRD